MDFDDETENRVTLMVHNIRPPFLDGRIAFTTQMQIVSTVSVHARGCPGGSATQMSVQWC
jgi:hypothetical protein